MPLVSLRWPGFSRVSLAIGNRSGVNGRLAYNISNGLTAGVNLSYDQAFDTHFSADLKYRFGSNDYGAPKKQQPSVMPVIQPISATPAEAYVRVHDNNRKQLGLGGSYGGGIQ